MNRKLKLVAVVGLSALVTLCSGQERFETGSLKGFTKSPTEHIINECREPFTVRHVKGVLLDVSGAAIPNALFELQDESGRINAATTDSKGRFNLNGVANGRYRFKATLNGFQSLVGDIIVSSKANKAQRISITLNAGV